MTPDLEPEIYDQARVARDHQALRARPQLRQGAGAAARPGAPGQRRQPLHRHGASAHQLSRDPDPRAAVSRAHGRLLHRRRSRHRLSRCAPIAPRASPVSTIRRSRASTCRNSTPSGRPAPPKSARSASHAAERCIAPCRRPHGARYPAPWSGNPTSRSRRVIERDARFLLVEERIRGRLVLNQPAGHLEDGESLLEAVVRETLEETAWQLHARSALLGIYLWRSPRGHSHAAHSPSPARCSDFDAGARARSADRRDALADARRKSLARSGAPAHAAGAALYRRLPARPYGCRSTPLSSRWRTRAIERGR